MLSTISTAVNTTSAQPKVHTPTKRRVRKPMSSFVFLAVWNHAKQNIWKSSASVIGLGGSALAPYFLPVSTSV